MSLGTETLRSSGSGSENLDEDLKKLKLSYTRDFLLSLRDLEQCKKLPSGFDESLLGEFEDGLQGLQDRTRVSGSHHFQGFRKNEYGSSPPTRRDSANSTLGNYVKAGSRSSIHSDRDSDSHSDRDSESGRHGIQQSRRTWHATEHDGLLGSGSFTRHTGFASGSSATKNNENYPLKKSNEPYQPPRPYKAVPYSKRDTDSYDETFGSSDSISEDRVEEERRRRASFEQMRKEQQKALQEKQMEHNVDNALDIFVQHGNKKGDRESLVHKDELQILAADHTLKTTLGKSSAVSSSPAYRPLVPPGFRNSVPEKTPDPKYNQNHLLLEKGKFFTEDDILATDTSFRDGRDQERFTDQKVEAEGQLSHVSSGLLDDPGMLKLRPHVLNDKEVANHSSEASSSLLERMFWSPVSSNQHGVPSLSEGQVHKPDDARSSVTLQSSRFAQLFFEAEPKPTDESSSKNPADMLSLILNGDKGLQPAEHLSSDILLKSTELPGKLLPASSSSANVIKEPASVNSKDKSFPTILTCEDLENSILAEATTNLPASNSWSSHTIVEPSNEHVDGNASLHLLSLLQKNTNQSLIEEKPAANMGLSDKPLEDAAVVSKDHGTGGVNSENKLTLELLFGSAFMKELQSVEAPLSIQRSFVGTEPHPVQLSHGDTQILSSVDSINQPHSGQPLHAFKDALQNRGHEGITGGSTLSSGPRGYQMLANVPIDRHLTGSARDLGTVLGSETMVHRYGLYENIEPGLPYSNLPVQHSHQFQHLPMAVSGQLHNPVSPYSSLTSKVEAPVPDTFYNHDSVRRSAGNVGPFRELNIGVPGLDAAASHHLHQMPMPGNYGEFPGIGIGIGIGNGYQETNFRPESNSNLPFPAQHHILGHLTNTPGTGIIHRNSPPETFQRLVEVEKSAHFKQMHPFGSGHGQGIPWA